MNITLSPETQKLLDEQMKKGHYATPDETMLAALPTLDEVHGDDYEDLDADTRKAIEEAEAQYQQGEGRPWSQVREELINRFVKKYDRNARYYLM